MATVTHRRLVLILALGVGLGLAGCSSDDEKVATPQQDKAAAERAVLTEADVPDMTRDEDDPSDDEEDPSDAAFEECVNNNVLLTNLGEDERGAESTFSNDDSSSTRGSSVTFAPSEDEAKSAFAELERSTFAGCFQDVLRTSFDEEVGAEATVSEFSVEPLTVEELGDETAAFRAMVTLEGPGQTLELSFDFVFVRVDRAIGGLFAFDVGDPLDPAERVRLSEIITERMEDA